VFIFQLIVDIILAILKNLLNNVLYVYSFNSLYEHLQFTMEIENKDQLFRRYFN